MLDKCYADIFSLFIPVIVMLNRTSQIQIITMGKTIHKNWHMEKQPVEVVGKSYNHTETQKCTRKVRMKLYIHARTILTITVRLFFLEMTSKVNQKNFNDKEFLFLDTTSDDIYKDNSYEFECIYDSY